MIHECNCQNRFQDRTYGFGMRVHTQSQKQGQADKYCCTVCGTKKSLNATPRANKDDKKKKKK